MSLQIGQMVNHRYRIDELLGQGGFGAVYRAWDTNFELPCALKENTETGDAARRQFLREARILHTLRHPNLPLVKDYFLIPDQGQYLVMDYIQGDDLQTILAKRGRMIPETQVVEWLVQICDALAYLHSQNPPVIHRDIKPANIKITPDGRAILVDFGISKIFEAQSPTTQGARAVTPGYSPFEQYGNAPTDHRTDIYSLGATAYTLLTGEIPTDSIARMAGQELRRPAQLRSEISPEIEQAILHAMASLPAGRYNRVLDFKDDLLATLGTVRQDQAASSQSAEKARPSFDLPPMVSAEKVKAAEPGLKRPVVSPQPVKVGRSKKAGTRIPMWTIFALFALLVLSLAGFLVWRRIALIRSGIINLPAEETLIETFIGGRWVGRVIVRTEGGHELPMQIEIDQPPGSLDFTGVVHLEFPNEGRVEDRRIVEGHIRGDSAEFLDDRGLFFRGVIRENEIRGPAAWRCFECDYWGDFELFRD